jgi:hypothetical protein
VSDIERLGEHVQQRVLLRGWLYNRRSSKKVHFLEVRDGTGIVQCVVGKNDVDPEVFERADRLAQVVPEGRSPIRSLTHQYVLQRFSPDHDTQEAFDPAAEWQVLRPILLRKSVVKQVQRLRRLRLRR